MGSVTLSTGTLVLRADASARIGAGHMMRCFALAQAWQLGGGQVSFLSYCENDALRQRITNADVEVVPIASPHPEPRDLQTTLEALRTRSAGTTGNPAWLVLDGYHFDPAYQQAVRAARYRLMVIDDIAHWPDYHADILLNQNLGAETLKYNHDPDTALLLGSRYALLRQEFLTWHGWRRETQSMARRVLVTMGGGDSDNVTLKVINALEQVQLNGLEAVVVVGGSNPHGESLRSASRNSQVKIRLERDPLNMPELMAWADVAISASGSTCWELAFMGLPSLVVAIADNQLGVAKQLETLGMAVNLGWHRQVTLSQMAQSLKDLLASDERRTALAQRCHAQVDGDGVDRVLGRIHGDRLRLRHVREADRSLLWEWANEPQVRAASFSTDIISWEQHVQWFAAKQKDPNCVFYFALNEAETPLGQVRYDIDGTEATISISLDAKYRGQGYGSQLITLASQKLCQTLPVQLIHAYVKERNDTSARAFLKAKFIEDKIIFVHDQPARHLILSRERII
jgi:UDP-2,4-diacetamido-2,4,6-trideoxy-beta-L-altropyranose hydrolase